MNIIEISNLKKSFKDVHAVDDITFRVKEGELFSFLGLNGAGKSTTISIMCGQLAKDRGTVIINGQDIDRHPDKIKKDIGIVFQNSVLDKVLTVKDNLKSRAALYGIKGKAFENRLEELNRLLELQELLKRPVGKLSGGQRRRIDVARALLHDPKILILDEPTTGLDPKSRLMVWGVVEQLRKTTGLTVFLTTHYMEEAAESDYVVILDSGQIAAEGTPNDLKNQYARDFIKLYRTDGEALRSRFLSYEKENGYLKIPVANTEEAKKLLLENQDLFHDFEIVKGNMDDVFLAATGKKLKEA
ncbi:MAG: ABC transporter ATP-binding protein [Bacillota bacterium]|nr:ABC transporter ATP-binding protein [Bacillota bacterium]